MIIPEIMRGPAESVFAALIASALIPFMHMRLIRKTGRPEAAIKYEFVSIAACGACWAAYALWRFGLRPQPLAAGTAMYGFMALGYMEAFSMLCRGFSLHIMADLHARGPMTVGEILATYGGGKGVDWLMEKRLGSMRALGLIRIDGDRLVLGGWRGTLAGWVGLTVKRTLNMGGGG